LLDKGEKFEKEKYFTILLRLMVLNPCDAGRVTVSIRRYQLLEVQNLTWSNSRYGMVGIALILPWHQEQGQYPTGHIGIIKYAPDNRRCRTERRTNIRIK